MKNSRRGFLRTFGGGVVAGTLPSTMPMLGYALRFEPTRPKHSSGVTLLNSNENAYGPSPHVKARLNEALAMANRYPVSQDPLTARLAALHRVSPDQVLIGCGSTELIRAVAAAFVEPQKSVLTAAPTFEAIAQYAKDRGAEPIAVPLDVEYAHNLDAMLSRVDKSTRVIYICNPNNPTASLTPRRKIEQFLTQAPPDIIVVIDEAYHHFVIPSSYYASFLDQPVSDDRLIVLRTFSKVFGLAGMRIGYAVASPKVTRKLAPHVTDSGVSEVALEAALTALDDEQGLHFAIKRNADDRQEFFNQAQARMLKPINSKTNFMMMNTYHPAPDIIEHFRKNNVLIGRPFPPLDTFIRISFGTPENMREFWRVWDLLPFSHGMNM